MRSMPAWPRISRRATDAAVLWPSAGSVWPVDWRRAVAADARLSRDRPLKGGHADHGERQPEDAQPGLDSPSHA